MYLVINLGLKSIRAIVFNDKGRVVFSSNRPVNTWLIGDFVEQDSEEWKKLFHELLEEITIRTSINRSLSHIKYITCTTSSSCIFGMDQYGNSICPVMMVSDKRATNESKKLRAILSNSDILNSGQLSVAPSSVVPKVLWVKENLPEVYEKVDHWMGAGEYLSYLLTGEVFTDHLNASKALYLEDREEYIIDSISELDLDSSTFPPVVKIGESFSFSPEIIGKYKISRECKYILTTYDAICAVIGSSTGEKGNACDVSGTVTSVRLLAEFNEIKNGKQSAGLNLNTLPIIKKQVIGCSNNMGGGIIEWYKQAFFVDDSGQNVYSLMESEAIESGVGANGVLFLPYLLGERSPFLNKHIRASFLGINRDNTRSDFSRAVIESTAFVTNDLINKIKSSVDEISSLSVSGGLARFDIVNKVKADVTNLPVNVLDNFESTSIGALIILRMAIGDYSDYNQAVKDNIEIRQTIYPNKHNVELYEEIYDLFLDGRSNILKFSERQWKLKEKLSRKTKRTIKNL